MGLLLVACCSFSFGQKRTYDVEVVVGSSDKNLANTVESYITRELRTLGDVNLVKTKPLYSLRLIALKQENAAGNHLGYVISVVAVLNISCTLYGNPDTCNLFDDHLVYVDGKDKLREICEEIVTDFDTRILKPVRKE